MEGRPRSSNHRASLAVLLGFAAVLVIPAGVAVAQQSAALTLLDVGWAIPVAGAFGFVAIGFSNLARARIQWTLGRAGGEGRARAARILGFVGLCIAASAAIAIGFYEILLRFE